MGDITQAFSRHEFACKCGCGFDDIDERLVHRLQVVRDIIKIPMIINSGCRCVEHNKNVGGAGGSYHLIGEAADWHFDIIGVNSYFRACMLLRDWSGGFHYYKRQKFFHCDIGPKRRW